MVKGHAGHRNKQVPFPNIRHRSLETANANVNDTKHDLTSSKFRLSRLMVNGHQLPFYTRPRPRRELTDTVRDDQPEFASVFVASLICMR